MSISQPWSITRFSTRAFIVVVWLTFLSPALATAAPPQGYNFLNLTEAFEQSKGEQKPILLYFGRYGCSTCRKMHKEVFSDQGLNKKYSDQFVLAYVDTESGNRIRLPSGERTTEMQFAGRSRILGTPTFIYFSNEQKPLFKRTGFQTIKKMGIYSDYVTNGHYKTKTLKTYLGAK